MAFILFLITAVQLSAKTAIINPVMGLTPETSQALANVLGQPNHDRAYLLIKKDSKRILSALQVADYAIKLSIRNIINMNTEGYKRKEFVVQRLKLPAKHSDNNLKALLKKATRIVFQMGSLKSTGHQFDIAIGEPNGFFKLRSSKGFVFTRNGSFKIDSRRQLISSNGYTLIPELTIPDDVILETVSISENGVVSGKVANKFEKFGQVLVHSFPVGTELTDVGTTFLRPQGKARSKEVIPGHDGTGGLLQGFLEMSNVNIRTEYIRIHMYKRLYSMLTEALKKVDNRFVGLNEEHIYSPFLGEIASDIKGLKGQLQDHDQFNFHGLQMLLEP